MITIAQPLLIKRIDPSACAINRARLNPSARVALLVMLAFAAYSMTQIAAHSRSAPVLAASPARVPTGSQSRLAVASANRRAAGDAVHASDLRGRSSSARIAFAPPRRADGGDTHRAPSDRPSARRLEYRDAAGWLSTRLGYYNAAVSYLSEAIQKNPRDGRAYDQRAEVYRRMGKPAPAINDFEHALTIDPHDTKALNGLAWLLSTSPARAVRDHKRAIMLAQQACILTGWRDANAVETLAAAYASAGAFDKAIKMQGQALTLEHDASQSAARLARYSQHQTAEPIAIL